MLAKLLITIEIKTDIPTNCNKTNNVHICEKKTKHGQKKKKKIRARDGMVNEQPVAATIIIASDGLTPVFSNLYQ